MVKKKVLLINRGLSDNLGDQAIKFTLEKLLEANGCEVFFSDFTEYKKDQSYEYRPLSEKVTNESILKKFLCTFFPIGFLRRVSWFVKSFRIFKVCFSKYDSVFIGGGQLFNSNYVFPLAMFIWVNLIKIVSPKSKIVIFGVGAMKEYSALDKYLYSNALKKVDRVYLRDQESIKIIRELFNKNAIYVPDVAFYINNFYSIDSITQKCEKDGVLIGLTDYNRYKKYNNDKSENEYYKEWEEIILKYLDKKENKTKLFYTTISDLKEAIKMQRNIMKKYNKKIEIVEIKCLDDLIFNLAKAKIVISPRMHALIIAFVFGAEVRPYVMSDKIRVFKEYYLDENVSLDKLQIDIKLRLLEAINLLNIDVCE